MAKKQQPGLGVTLALMGWGTTIAGGFLWLNEQGITFFNGNPAYYFWIGLVGFILGSCIRKMSDG